MYVINERLTIASASNDLDLLDSFPYAFDIFIFNNSQDFNLQGVPKNDTILEGLNFPIVINKI